MIARGALGNPWVFEELTGRRAEPPRREEVVAELLWTIDRAEEHLGSERATRYLRKFYPWYVDSLQLDEECRRRSCSRAPTSTAPARSSPPRASLSSDPRKFLKSSAETALTSCPSGYARAMKWTVSLVTLCCAALLLPANALATTTDHLRIHRRRADLRSAGRRLPGRIRRHRRHTAAKRTGRPAGKRRKWKGNLDVDQRQTLYIEVGGNGQSAAEGGEGGFNGGGSSGGGGGGGASDIRTAPSVDAALDRRHPPAWSPPAAAVAARPAGEPGGAGGAAGSAGSGETNYRRWRSGDRNRRGRRRLRLRTGRHRRHRRTWHRRHRRLQLRRNRPRRRRRRRLLRRRRRRRRLRRRQQRRRRRLLASSRRWPLMTLTSAGPEIEITYNPPPSVTITTPSKKPPTPRARSSMPTTAACRAKAPALKTCSGEDWMRPGGQRRRRRHLGTSANSRFGVLAEDNDKGQSGQERQLHRRRERRTNRRPRARHPPGRLRAHARRRRVAPRHRPSARTRRKPSRPRRRRPRSNSASAPTSPARPSSASSTRAPSPPAPRRRPTRPSRAGTPSRSRPSLRPAPTPRLRPSASRSRRRRRKSVRGGEVASL